MGEGPLHTNIDPLTRLSRMSAIRTAGTAAGFPLDKQSQNTGAIVVGTTGLYFAA